MNIYTFVRAGEEISNKLIQTSHAVNRILVGNKVDVVLTWKTVNPMLLLNSKSMEQVSNAGIEVSPPVAWTGQDGHLLRREMSPLVPNASFKRIQQVEPYQHLG